jgi:hypothetical protein
MCVRMRTFVCALNMQVMGNMKNMSFLISAMFLCRRCRYSFTMKGNSVLMIGIHLWVYQLRFAILATSVWAILAKIHIFKAKIRDVHIVMSALRARLYEHSSGCFSDRQSFMGLLPTFCYTCDERACSISWEKHLSSFWVFVPYKRSTSQPLIYT